MIIYGNEVDFMMSFCTVVVGGDGDVLSSAVSAVVLIFRGGAAGASK